MVLSEMYLTGIEHFESKFIRVGNDVYITDPDDIATLHYQLAEKHKISERIEQLKEQQKDEVDGGLIFISGRIIRIGAASDSLGIPVTERARRVTLQKLIKQMPDFNIQEVASI